MVEKIHFAYTNDTFSVSTGFKTASESVSKDTFTLLTANAVEAAAVALPGWLPRGLRIIALEPFSVSMSLPHLEEIFTEPLSEWKYC